MSDATPEICADDIKFPGNDIVEIYGIKYAGILMRHFAISEMAKGKRFEILSREDGMVTIRTFDKVLNEERAQEIFLEYFQRNYPGPHTIISDPLWHGPRIFRALIYSLEQAERGGL